ncbi:GNAT family N-acetyltransferase [Streptomyces dioscori]|uniref:GNAT family N-acetyltransferase n=1 Tax=Streptomyces dioscori TaxID=2109333 RepID=A0A2P8Q0I1_9ACTN|nr:GNAT family N-acetyltransferase [Streptomyces dioscori]PSM39757.1 GNAT family N-acetyltransferase [Streptomyces dioscori]
MTAPRIRALQEADYPSLIAQVDDWWGRPAAHMLPRLFLRHFHATSLAAVTDQGVVAGFLVGIVSPSEPGEAHTHFIAVAPGHRRSGLGGVLYGRFFELAGEQGCRTVTAVVSPGNTRSQRFHLATGFEPVPLPSAGPPDTKRLPDTGGPTDTKDLADTEGLPVWKDWDGPGEDRVRFSYAL